MYVYIVFQKPPYMCERVRAVFAFRQQADNEVIHLRKLYNGHEFRWERFEIIEG